MCEYTCATSTSWKQKDNSSTIISHNIKFNSTAARIWNNTDCKCHLPYFLKSRKPTPITPATCRTQAMISRMRNAIVLAFDPLLRLLNILSTAGTTPTIEKTTHDSTIDNLGSTLHSIREIPAVWVDSINRVCKTTNVSFYCKILYFVILLYYIILHYIVSY